MIMPMDRGFEWRNVHENENEYVTRDAHSEREEREW